MKYYYLSMIVTTNSVTVMRRWWCRYVDCLMLASRYVIVRWLDNTVTVYSRHALLTPCTATESPSLALSRDTVESVCDERFKPATFNIQLACFLIGLSHQPIVLQGHEVTGQDQGNVVSVETEEPCITPTITVDNVVQNYSPKLLSSLKLSAKLQ